MPKKIFIIAEAGVNHNGSLDLAEKMVDAASRAGADAIKFQTFKAEVMVSRLAQKAAYQKKNAGQKESQFAMLKRLELDAKAHQRLLRRCRKRGIVFLSSPFDLESIDLLDSLDLGIFKIPSGEITNFPYLRKIGALRKRVILSTGMSVLAEIKKAMDVLIASGTRKQDIIVLHCISEYPLPVDNVNLAAMLTLKKALGVNVGYSDHTLGIEMPIAAAALGACVIEKHFTLDRDMRGPDHAASIDPDGLRQMVSAVRTIERGLGNGIKRLTREEKNIKKAARKSIVAGVAIPKGTKISADMLEIKRPGTGIAPGLIHKLTGRTAGRDIKQDAPIKYKDIR